MPVDLKKGTENQAAVEKTEEKTATNTKPEKEAETAKMYSAEELKAVKTPNLKKLKIETSSSIQSRKLKLKMQASKLSKEEQDKLSAEILSMEEYMKLLNAEIESRKE